MAEYIDKSVLFKQIEKDLITQGFTIVNVDQTRPWGGFFVISEDQAQIFADYYFDGIDIKDLKISEKLSPKILIIAPQKRLSWQYHHRRAEIWRITQGEIGVITSNNDDQNELKKLAKGDVIRIAQGERHRLIGLDSYGVVAEMWQHTDTKNPSDEDDITRIQDDFGR